MSRNIAAINLCKILQFYASLNTNYARHWSGDWLRSRE